MIEEAQPAQLENAFKSITDLDISLRGKAQYEYPISLIENIPNLRSLTLKRDFTCTRFEESKGVS